MSFFSDILKVATAAAVVYFAPELLLSPGASMAARFAVTFAASLIVSRIFAPNQQAPATQQNNIRQQVPPDPTAGIPIVYGDAYTGGRFVDAVLTTNHQSMYYVMVISCISPNGQFSYDTSKFYYQDQKITFDSVDHTKVIKLTDGAGNIDTSISGQLYIWLYTSDQNGTITPINSSAQPSSVISTANGIADGQQWTGTRQMNGLAFAIVKLNYNQNSPGTISLQPITFHVSHYLNGAGCAKPGDVWYDYLTNTIYGGAIPTAYVDSAAATALNTYADQTISYIPYSGGIATQPRYRINGVLDTGQTVLSNLDIIMNCCDSWQTYQASTGLWTVSVNQVINPSFAFDDTNIIGAITIGSIDITQQSNQIEARYNDATNRDQSGYVNLTLQSINPALLYPNEPVNKYTVSLDLVNDSVTAQYLATRTLLQNRIDLTVSFSTNYTGIQVNAGDVITVTNVPFGWSNKQFRVMQVKEAVLNDGTLGAALQCIAYDPSIYTISNIQQYTPTPNSNLANPNTFGVVPAPTIGTLNQFAPVPFFNVTPTASSLGIIEYAEVWYSAYGDGSNLIFYGTTAVISNGSSYANGAPMPGIQVKNLAAGDWYFYARMINGAAQSQYSPASAVVHWRPSTYQYADRYIAVAYATSITGAGFSFSPRGGATYFGIYNTNVNSADTDPASYTWYLAPTPFSTDKYLLWANYNNYLVAYSVGTANLAAGTATFVPSDTGTYDPSIWQALPDGFNVIDLNVQSGQFIQTGTTTVGTGEIAILNNQQGQVVASLAQLLNFGSGVYTKTSSAATITIDIYGRVVGFATPDSFYYTMTAIDASAGQTVFNVTRASGYINGQCFVFQNGCKLNPSEYTDSFSNVTLNIGANANDIVTIISFRSTNSVSFATTAASGTGSVATLTFLPQPYAPFVVGSQIVVAGVTPAGYNGTYTVTACTTTTVSFASTATGAQTAPGSITYLNGVYPSYRFNDVTLSNQSSYTASGFVLNSGSELMFLNGTVVNAQDYNISGQTITFVQAVTGDLQIVQWNLNNLGVNNGTPVNTDIYTTPGQALYSFSFDPNAFNLYDNGCLLLETVDYSVTTGSYTLAQTPTTNLNILVQETFTRAGAA